MPKAVTEIRSLARSHTRTALNVLVAVMRNTKATPPARVAAANALLDRGWGKPTQSLANDDSALELIHRIVRVIVHPDILTELHHLTFFNGASVPSFDGGHWWLAFREATAVAFAGVVPSTHVRNAGYFCRVGVLQRHWGHHLQLRLMRAGESRARRNGWTCLVSDTTGNIVSANNFIRAGYRMYAPPYPWAFPDTLYWRKNLISGSFSS